MKNPNDVSCQPSNISWVLTAFQYHVALVGIITLLMSTTLWVRDFTVVIYWWGNQGWKSWRGLLSSPSLWALIPPHPVLYHCIALWVITQSRQIGYTLLAFVSTTWLWAHLNSEYMFRQKKTCPTKLNVVFDMKDDISCCCFPPCYSDMQWLQKTCRFQGGNLFR